MSDVSNRLQSPCLMLLCDGDADIGRAICSKFLALHYCVILAGAQIENASWVSVILKKHEDVQILPSLDQVADVAGYAEGLMDAQAANVFVHVAADVVSRTSAVLIEAVAHGMAADHCGRIIHISAGRNGAVVSSDRIAATDADAFIGALAGEMAHRSVTVNTITLGCIETTITSPQMNAIDSRNDSVNVCRADSGKLEEIAGLTAYLASDEAAGIHGANIAINMGRYLS